MIFFAIFRFNLKKKNYVFRVLKNRLIRYCHAPKSSKNIIKIHKKSILWVFEMSKTKKCHKTVDRQIWSKSCMPIFKNGYFSDFYKKYWLKKVWIFRHITSYNVHAPWLKNVNFIYFDWKKLTKKWPLIYQIKQIVASKISLNFSKIKVRENLNKK